MNKNSLNFIFFSFLLQVFFFFSTPYVTVAGERKVDLFECYVSCDDKLVINGRVHSVLSGSKNPFWENLKLFFSNEHENQWLKVKCQGKEYTVKTDNHGKFSLDIPGFDRKKTQNNVEFVAINPPEGEKGVRVKKSWNLRHNILQAFNKVPKYGTINDFDDTNIITEAYSKKKLMRNTFFKKMTNRKVVPGAPEVMQGYAKGKNSDEENYTFYVTGSPTDLFGSINKFMEKHGFPKGPMRLRQIGFRSFGRKGFLGWVFRKLSLGNEKTEDDLLHGYQYKIDSIRKILNKNPGVIFDLRGDAGEEDPEIYSQIAMEFPNRIGKIYIRNVGQKDQNPDRIKKLQAKLKQKGVSAQIQLVENEFETALDAYKRGRMSKEAALKVGQKVQESGQLPKNYNFSSVLGQLPAIKTKAKSYLQSLKMEMGQLKRKYQNSLNEAKFNEESQKLLQKYKQTKEKFESALKK
ncbi:phosphatase domain-containing protein [Candidatus Riflebacteria bacterium]